MPKTMHRRRLAAAALMLTAFLVPAAAAEQKGNLKDTQEPFAENRARFNALIRGEAQPDAVKDKVLLEATGRYLVYRLTWPTYLEAKPSQPGLKDIHNFFSKDVFEYEATKSGKNKEFMRLLVKATIPCFKDVLGMDIKDDVSNRQPVINCAMMLPVFAKCKQEEVGDFLVSILKDKKYHPFIRMYAVRAMSELFPAFGPRKLEPLVENNPKGDIEKRNRDLERLEAVKAYIYEGFESTADKTQEQKDAVVFLRREGVKTLAQFQLPALTMEKSGKVIGPAAYYLALLLTRDPKNGEYYCQLPERIDAAIGICQLTPGEIAAPQYRPEVGLYLVGTTMVDAVNDYIADWSYFSKKEKTDVAARQSKIPWKVTAMRVRAALDDMVANLGKDSESGKKAAALRKEMDDSLKLMQGLKNIVIPPTAFGQFVERELRPKSWEIYQGNKELVIPEQGKLNAP